MDGQMEMNYVNGFIAGGIALVGVGLGQWALAVRDRRAALRAQYAKFFAHGRLGRDVLTRGRASDEAVDGEALDYHRERFLVASYELSWLTRGTTRAAEIEKVQELLGTIAAERRKQKPDVAFDPDFTGAVGDFGVAINDLIGDVERKLSPRRSRRWCRIRRRP